MTGSKVLKLWYRLPGSNGGPLDPQSRGGDSENYRFSLVYKGYPVENRAIGNQDLWGD